MKYNIIATGSRGNAVVIEESILIDCGVSFKKLKDYYKQFKIVLLTHIHSDHFNKTTIKTLAKERPTLRFGCCEWLVNDLIDCEVDKSNIDVFEIGKTYDYDMFKVSPLYLYHDVDNCGYRLFMSDKKALYITDTHTLEGIEAKNYDLYLVEANYSDDEIEQRIKEKQEKGEFVYEYRAKETHLSQAQTDEFLLKNMGDNSSYEYLHGHVD